MRTERQEWLTSDAIHFEEYLLRFGTCCLAANDLARQQNPQWPLADAYEQHLASQLASLPGGLTITNQV